MTKGDIITAIAGWSMAAFIWWYLIDLVGAI